MKKIQSDQFLAALSKAGVVNEKVTLKELMSASAEISRGSETNLTVVYDDDKYFAVVK